MFEAAQTSTEQIHEATLEIEPVVFGHSESSDITGGTLADTTFGAQVATLQDMLASQVTFVHIHELTFTRVPVMLGQVASV